MLRALFVAICIANLQLSAKALSDSALTGFLDEASKEEDWLVQIRRELHQWPELMYQEHNTSLFLRKVLDNLGISYK